MRLIHIIFIFSLFLSLSAHAAPVWKVSKDEQVLFLGGTIHVLSASDYPLPKTFEEAYQQAEIIVLEADLSAMQTAEMQRLVAEKTMYQDGTVIQQVLSPQTYQQLSLYLQQRGGDIRALHSFKPGMLSIILTLNELQRLGLSGEGVDAYFDNKAIADNKPRLFLETIEQQLDFLGSMGEGQEDSLMRYSLHELNNLSSMMSDLKAAWRSGNRQSLINIGLTPWVDEFPAMYQSLLVKRNNDWMPKIQAMLTTPEIEYVLVGALHLVGEHGLLKQLETLGYRIEAL